MGTSTVAWGLEGIQVKESGICFIDLDNGRIYYRGYDLTELANMAGFEEVTYLLLHGKLPNREELNAIKAELARNRELPSELLTLLRSLPRGLRPIDVLRLSIDYLGTLDREASSRGSHDYEKALALIARAPTIVATYHRLSTGNEVSRPRSDLDHAANYFYMFFGREPSDVERRALETMLITYMEHSMNNSAFTAITVASTWSDIYSAIVAALSSLKGPLHGGASFEALKTIVEVGDPAKAEDYVISKVRRGEKIIGFGHRLYKKYTDPRVNYLRTIAGELAREKGGEYQRLYETALALEKAVEKHLSSKGVYANTDLYASLIFYTLGFPPEYNPANFAIARIVGWVAHVLEYWQMNGRLIRPTEKYVGPIGLKYVPLNERP
ncbi:MAG: citrate synthase/methylcitrate synthase [Vulcanisaeta sp.]|jgi:citrate synthase